MSAPFGIDKPPSATPWQYSLKTLLWLTTIVSICLAIGVHFAGFMLAVVVIGLIQAVIVLGSDWLIRPENRRALAFVTAGSWIVLGSGLWICGGYQIYDDITSWRNEGGVMLGVPLIIAGVFCYFIAAWRWRKLIPRTTKDVAVQESS